MKKLLFIAAAFVISSAAFSQTKAEESIKFSGSAHDFGKIKQGVPVTYDFQFTNIADKPVVVENASASCGCTIPEKPEKPIGPGETGKIKVQYNAAAVAPFNKDVYIKLAGVDQQKVVHISGEVIASTENSAAKKN